MSWETFYDNFYGWADSTQANYISKLTSFGDHEEVAEIVQSYSDEKVATRFVRKALANGVIFTTDEIIDFQGCVTEDCLNELVRSCKYPFTEEQVEALVYSIDDKLYKELERNYCNYENDLLDFTGNFWNDFRIRRKKRKKEKKPGKLFGLMAFTAMLLDKNDDF